MTQVEMLSGLAQDIRDLRTLLNQHNELNHQAHIELTKQLAAVDKKAGINGAKLAFITGVAAVLSAGIVSAGLAFVG